MLEHKHKAILSWNPKKIASHVDNFKIIIILRNEMLFFMVLCKHVLKQREDIPRYGKTINNSFLETVYSTIFCSDWLFKNLLMHLSTKVVGKGFFFNTSFE